jgi:nucleoside-diphosphate-sugar epimerase
MNDRMAEDLNEIIGVPLDFKEFSGKSILITGGTGLVGSALIRALLHINRTFSLNMHIVSVSRDKKKANEIFADIAGGKDFNILAADIAEGFSYDGKIDYIFHAASLTSSADFTINPVETIDTAVNGTLNMLRTAVSCRAEKFIYVSSLEVYGADDPRKMQDDGSPLGHIDISLMRSSYPESKRLCELLCNAFTSEYGLDCRIARLAQVFGAGVKIDDSRIFAQFARSVINGEDILLHTSGGSEGNYCYLSEAVTGLLFILLKGGRGETYNVSNEKTHMTIREMANTVAHEVAPAVIGRSLKVISKSANKFDISRYPKAGKLFLDASRLHALGWEPKYSVREMYIRMIEDMLRQ